MLLYCISCPKLQTGALFDRRSRKCHMKLMAGRKQARAAERPAAGLSEPGFALYCAGIKASA
jgi:hypothetical protein